MPLVFYHFYAILGTDILKGDPLGLLDITDEVGDVLVLLFVVMGACMFHTLYGIIGLVIIY